MQELKFIFVKVELIEFSEICNQIKHYDFVSARNWNLNEGT